MTSKIGKYASSDGVPPELVVLGFRGVSASSGLTGLRRTSLVKIVCDPRVLVLLCDDQNCVNTHVLKFIGLPNTANISFNFLSRPSF